MSPTDDLGPLLQAAEKQFPTGTPVMMLNLIRYREVAADVPGRDAPARSGRQAYFDSYLPAFQQVTADEGVAGVEVTFAGRVQAALIAPDGEHWDDIAIVRYPSFAAFRQIAGSVRYVQQAEPHRRAAVAELQLYATSAIEIPADSAPPENA